MGTFAVLATHSCHSSNRNGVMSRPSSGESDAPEHPIRQKRKTVVHQRLPRLHVNMQLTIAQATALGRRLSAALSTCHYHGTQTAQSAPHAIMLWATQVHHNCRGLCLAPIVRCSHIDTKSSKLCKYAQSRARGRSALPPAPPHHAPQGCQQQPQRRCFPSSQWRLPWARSGPV